MVQPAHRRPGPLRFALVTLPVGASAVVGGVGLALALARLARQQWAAVTGPVPAAPADALTGLVAATGALTALWLAVGFAVSLAAGLPGPTGTRARALSRRISPPAVRRAAALVLGGVLVASAATPALATRPSQPGADGDPVTVTRVVPPPTDGFSPDLVPAAAPPATGGTPRPTARPTAGPATRGPAADLGVLGPRPPRDAPDRTAPAPSTVTVVPGDSLWAIAAARLGPDAGAAEVAAAWPRWFAANREVVGADPDLLLPGQVLHAPPVTQGR